jgi:hypothetical protein
MRTPYFLSTTVAVLLVTAVAVFGGAFLESFAGHSDGTNITLEWRTRTETGIDRYDIQRHSGEGGEFTTLATIAPKGSNSTYQFVDRAAYKETGTLYVYRLKIVEEGSGSVSYSNEISVSHSVSGVRRTWGSIKAMFR